MLVISFTVFIKVDSFTLFGCCLFFTTHGSNSFVDFFLHDLILKKLINGQVNRGELIINFLFGPITLRKLSR